MRPHTWSATTIQFLTQAELRAFFRVITRKRDRALFLIAYRHGLRASEVGLLHLDDLNFAQQRLTIQQVSVSTSMSVESCWVDNCQYLSVTV
jgi:integrase